jgi:hypothetical protein
VSAKSDEGEGDQEDGNEEREHTVRSAAMTMTMNLLYWMQFEVLDTEPLERGERLHPK